MSHGHKLSCQYFAEHFNQPVLFKWRQFLFKIITKHEYFMTYTTFNSGAFLSFPAIPWVLPGGYTMTWCLVSINVD